MRRLMIIIFSTLLTINIYGQSKTKNIIWFGPADSVDVNGVNISPLMFKLPQKSTVNGINIEGIGIPIFLYMIPVDPTDDIDTLVIDNDFIVNGVNVSLAGILQSGTVNGLALTLPYSFISQVNGVDISTIFNISYKLNGLSIAISNATVELNGMFLGLFNKATKTKGIQIGIINKTEQLNGLQIGLWNINERKKSPIINW